LIIEEGQGATKIIIDSSKSICKMNRGKKCGRPWLMKLVGSPVEYLCISAILEGGFASKEFGSTAFALRKLQEIMAHGGKKIEICEGYE
jgi:hypothetical protein